MDEQELATIEARAAAATEGTWVVWNRHPDTDLRGPDLECWEIRAGAAAVVTTQDQMLYWPNVADVGFHADARADVLALVAEVRRLRAALDKLDADLGWFANGMRDPSD